MKKLLKMISVLAIVVVLGACLIACNVNEETYKAKLEKAGYDVEVMTQDDIDEMMEAMPIDIGIKWAVDGKKGTDEITVICFDEKEQAEAYETLFNMVSTDPAMAGIKVERKGAILFFGTEQGIKDAK